MKRINYTIVILSLLMAVFVFQSCSKDNEPTPQVFHAFTEPAVVAPLDAATIKITGTTAELKWNSTDADGDAVLCDVYFGTTESPALYKAGHNALSLTVPVEIGGTYYWKVTMKDKNGVMTYGPTWSFTIYDPISIYLGDFNCDEPAEEYSYDVSFVKNSASAIQTDNYWNSGWKGVFTLDLVHNTYSMPSTTWSSGYFGEESGTIDPATGTMVGNYTISRTKNGVTTVIETGVHTYTKK